jgi:hypothetical protein
MSTYLSPLQSNLPMWIHHLIPGVEFWHLNCDRVYYEGEEFTHHYDACVWFDGKLWLHLPEIDTNGIILAFKWLDDFNTFLRERGLEEFRMEGKDSTWKLVARILLEIDTPQQEKSESSQSDLESYSRP